MITQGRQIITSKVEGKDQGGGSVAAREACSGLTVAVPKADGGAAYSGGACSQAVSAIRPREN
jgi:hypothetical protein